MPTPTENQRDVSNELTRLMSVSEVADILAVDVRHIRRLVHERRIPFIKWGHLVRFDPAEVRTWIDGFRQRPELSQLRR